MQAYFVVHIRDSFRYDYIIPILEGNYFAHCLSGWDIPATFILLEEVVID